MSKIAIILASTREGRQGAKVAAWVHRVAETRKDHDFELVDLRDWPLPFYNLATSAAGAKGEYGNELANRWSAAIRSFDGFIIVTPEYNHGYPAVLKNALDWLYSEWNDKPVAFVGYSNGPIAGARSVEQLRLVAVALQMITIRHDLLIPSVTKQFSETGEIADPSYVRRLETMLDHFLAYVATFVLHRDQQKS